MTVMIAGTEAPKVEAGKVRTAGAIRAIEAMDQAGMPAGAPVVMATAAATVALPAPVDSGPVVLVTLIVQAADTEEERPAIVPKVDIEAIIRTVRNLAVFDVTQKAAVIAAATQVDPADSIVAHLRAAALIVVVVTARPAIAVPAVGIGRAEVSVAIVPVVHLARPTAALQTADRQIVDPGGSQKAGTAGGRAPVVTEAAGTQSVDLVETPKLVDSPPGVLVVSLTVVVTAATATARTVPQVETGPLVVADSVGHVETPHETTGRVVIARAAIQIVVGSVEKVVSAGRMPREAADTAIVGRPDRNRVATVATAPLTVAATVLPPIVPIQTVDRVATETDLAATVLVAIVADPAAIGRLVIVPMAIGRRSVASAVGTEVLSPVAIAEEDPSTAMTAALGHRVMIVAGTIVAGMIGAGMIVDPTIVRGMTDPGTTDPGTTAGPDKAVRTRTVHIRTDRPGTVPSTTEVDAIDRKARLGTSTDHHVMTARHVMTVRRGTTGARSKTAHAKTASPRSTVRSGRRSVEI